MPGRPPKPTNIHILQGTAQKCRMDKRKGELRVDAAMPDAPDWMPPEAQREWGRISTISKYAKALSEKDRSTLVTYCLLWAEIKAAVEKDGSSESIQSSRLMVFTNISAKLGMNPSDGVKIRSNEEEKPANRFAKIGR